jgi:3-hydroxymyristoyl/3-hydroxydecanoyl-(acyl carrier protein) dehydratase
MSSLFTAVARCRTAFRQVEAGLCEAEFVFPSDFPGFDGHFPGNPLLPGIVQIMAGMLTAFPAGQARLAAVRRAKFMRMVAPGQMMRVSARIRATEQGMLVDADCATEHGPCAQLKLLVDVQQ